MRKGGEIDMSRVEVGRYESDVGYKGWISTDAWILFERNDGALELYRCEEGGGVVGNPVVLN